jgi:serine/threonine-protein kinase
MRLLQDGHTIRDTYEVERFLGEGAFAEVYRVRHRFLGRQAMKVFKRVGMSIDEIQEMLGEAIILSQLKHPNIVSVCDANVFDTARGTCGFFTMEYLPGGSLDKFWRSHGAHLIPVETTVDLIKQVCRGLTQAHRGTPPIIHRDIKPQNILVGYEADGLRARVSDFGLATKVNPLTLLATAAGTLAFKPPEAFAERKGDSCAADVWALGVTLYLLLTDQLPFHVDPDLGWANKQAFEKGLESPSSHNPDVDMALEKIVLRCIEKNPSERYPSARELLDALDGWRRPMAVQKPSSKRTVSSEMSKSVLGAHSPVNAEEGQHLARNAIARAKHDGRLVEAADLMEEAFNKSPSLRMRYADQVRLWRCGISM